MIRYQTRDGASGVDIVTPLRTDAGAVAAGRPGLAGHRQRRRRHGRRPCAAGRARSRSSGWVRADATGDAATVTDGSARAISSVQIAQAPRPARCTAASWTLEKETPAPRTPLVPAELPDLGNGPHFFYGLQWWFFGLLAVFGFCYLAYDERKKLRAARPAPAGDAPDPERSEGAEHPAVDREHHAADEARSG